MRKLALLLFPCVFVLVAHSQKSYSLAASANFDFLAQGLGMNDGGIGVALHCNFPAKNKLQLRAEASLDHFMGSKEDNPTMLATKAGPEYRFTKGLALAVLYGYVQYKEFRYDVHSGHVKFLLTARPPKHPKMLVGFQFTRLTGDYSYVHFAGISVGFQIL